MSSFKAVKYFETLEIENQINSFETDGVDLV